MNDLRENWAIDQLVPLCQLANDSQGGLRLLGRLDSCPYLAYGRLGYHDGYDPAL